MGCDIHIYLEALPIGSDKWVCIDISDDCNVSRDYDLFTKMANVRSRGETTPISEPRGLPEDISEEVKDYSYDRYHDQHSYSWLSAEEIREVCEWWMQHKGEPISFGLIDGEQLWDIPKKPHSPYIDVRIVFWFDS